MKKSLSIILIAILIIGGILASMPSRIFAVSMSSAKTVNVGDTVSVTVNLGKQVSAASFRLTFNSSVLTYNGANRGECNPSNGAGKFGYYGNNDDLSSVTFTFTAKAQGTSSVSIGPVSAKWGELEKPESISSGVTTSVTVNPKPTPTPTPEPTPVPTSNPTPEPTREPDRPNENNDPKVTDTPEPTQTTTPTPTPTPEPTEEPNNEEQNQTNETVSNETTNNETDNDKEKAPNKIIKIDESDVITIKNEENDVMIKAKPIAIKDENVTLSVALIEEETERFNDLTKMTQKIKGNKKFYDIKLLKDGLAVETNGYVTVYLPIPEGYNKKRLEAYSINEQTEKYEKRTGVVQGNYYTFTTDKLEAFALVEKEAPSKTSRIITMILMLLGAIAILAIITIIVKKYTKAIKNFK